MGRSGVKPVSPSQRQSCDKVAKFSEVLEQEMVRQVFEAQDQEIVKQLLKCDAVVDSFIDEYFALVDPLAIKASAIACSADITKASKLLIGADQVFTSDE